MKKIKKIIVTIAAGLVIFNTASTCASAAINNTGDICVPYADKIELKWRFSNGVLQYRHWNATRNYWIEPNWVNYKYGDDPTKM